VVIARLETNAPRDVYRGGVRGLGDRRDDRHSLGARPPSRMITLRGSRSMKLKMAVLVALLSSPFSAEAEGLDGNFLFSSCNDADLSFAHGWCVGQVSGMADMIRLENRERATHYWQSCIPSDATNRQLTDVTKKYLKEHPETRHLDSTMLILMAFGRAFPCPK